MQNPIKTLIETRISANFYDTQRPLSDEIITALVDQATRAPSAYNFQNWKFIAVRSEAAKLRLKDVAYGQQKVVDAPVTFIICGTLKAYEQLGDALKPSVTANILDQAFADSWVAVAKKAHEDNPELQRDEAMRSASLAAMTMMLAAEGMGLATGSMSGFDPHALTQAFNLAPTEIPVMLITVGYPASGNWPQKPRKPIADVITFV